MNGEQRIHTAPGTVWPSSAIEALEHARLTLAGYAGSGVVDLQGRLTIRLRGADTDYFAIILLKINSLIVLLH